MQITDEGIAFYLCPSTPKHLRHEFAKPALNYLVVYESARIDRPVMDSHAHSQPRAMLYRAVDLSEDRRETTRIVSDQGQAVRLSRKHSKFTVAAGLAVPGFALQAGSCRSLRYRVLKVVMERRLFSHGTLTEILDIDSHNLT